MRVGKRNPSPSHVGRRGKETPLPHPISEAGNREGAIPKESVCSITEIGPIYDHIPVHPGDHEQPPLDWPEGMARHHC